MDDKKKKTIYSLLLIVCTVILLITGSTFAYFTASISSNENAIDIGAASFAIEYEDDQTLNKSNLIPTIEDYVDIASVRTDPDTVCIDDNQNEICSVYTFTVKNPMLDNTLPIYVKLIPSVNTFENLYVKLLDEDKNIVADSKIHLLDDRYETEEDADGELVYKKDADGNRIKKANFDTLTMSPVVLDKINDVIPVATKDPDTGEIIRSTKTYSLVIWIMETGENQNEEDGSKMFAGAINVSASGSDGQGITGVISAVGNE